MRAARWVIAAMGAAVIALAAMSLPAEDLVNGLRGNTPLKEEPQAPKIWPVENKDVKRGRAYTSQPPTIPHSIEKYEITRNVNMCMYCHARVRNNEFGAPMVSATHYMDRDGQILGDVTPRRYFCTQCHVPQSEVTPPVANTFLDVDEIIARQRAAAAGSDDKEKKK